MKVKLDDWNEFQSNLDSAICILAYFKNLITKLHVIYVFNISNIVQLDVIYYLIHNPNLYA